MGTFLGRFDELHAAYQQGARYEAQAWKDVPMLRGLLKVYGPRRLERMADILLRLTPEAASAAGTPPTISGLSRGAASALRWGDGPGGAMARGDAPP